MLCEAWCPPAGRGHGGGYRGQYRAVFLICDEPLQEPEDLRLRTGAGCVRALNCKLRGLRIECAGVERRRIGPAQTATFTFYEKSSVFSGFHADETQDRE